jgi:hypothetical protein
MPRESREYTPGAKLRLVVDHLKAVRTLVEYVKGVGLKKDMQDFSNHLQQDLSRGILRPAGWEDLYASGGILYSSPKSESSGKQIIQKWNVVEDDWIAIAIRPSWPVNDNDDDDPYAELYVPENWEKRQQFIAELKPPPGFEHVSQYSGGELSETSAVFKYVKYESSIGPDGRFDAAGFVEGFRAATKSLVAMKDEIDQILDRLG